VKEQSTATSPCELASLYSIGALDESESALFEAHLLDGCAFCDAELAASNAVVDMLGFSAEPVSPPSALRERLLLETAQPAPDLFQDLVTGGDWRPHEIAGVATRTLHYDRESRTIVMLVRAGAGAVYPTHRHAAVEEMLMLYGDLAFRENRYFGGDYIRSEPGSVHQTGRTENGCMFLIRTSVDDEALPFDEIDKGSDRIAVQ
jgi:hypothetical protein